MAHQLLIAAGANAHVAHHLHAIAQSHRAALVPHARPEPLPKSVSETVPKRVRYIHLPLLSHIRVHGPALDYAGLFMLALLSGLGINGLGEAALIAAAVYVANHHVSVAPVVLIAAAGGFTGGICGFLAGRHGGRSVFTVGGPLARARRRMLEHSETVYLHYDTLAILITPGWAAGLHRVRWPKFLLVNLASALIWASALGLGAYYLGRRITTEFSDEIGWVVGGAAGVLVLSYVLRRTARSRSRRTAE